MSDDDGEDTPDPETDGRRDAEGKWLPGVSGNAAGRRRSRIREIEDQLIEWYCDSPKLLNVCKRLYTEALKGDVKAAQVLNETILGKPRQRVDVSGEDGEAIRVQMQQEARETLDFLKQIADATAAEDEPKPS